MHNHQATESPAISVLIPSFNGLELLKRHLPSVLSQLSSQDEVLVIDDGSSDGTSEYLLDYFKNPQLRVLRLAENERFAKAVNRGVIEAKNEYIFLCNNDVSLEKDCLKTVRGYFPDEAVFAVSCLEYEDSTSGEKSGKNKLWFSRGLFQHSKADDFLAGPTAWASGGSALFDKKKWLALSGFDEHFAPAYWEDVDLSFRARQRGWRVLFDPSAIVLHAHETTNTTIFKKQELENIGWRHGRYFAWKHAALFQKLAFLLWWPYWELKRKQQS